MTTFPHNDDCPYWWPENRGFTCICPTDDYDEYDGYGPVDEGGEA